MSGLTAFPSSIWRSLYSKALVTDSTTACKDKKSHHEAITRALKFIDKQCNVDKLSVLKMKYFNIEVSIDYVYGGHIKKLMGETLAC